MNIKREPALLWIGLVAPFAQLLTILLPSLGDPWQTLLLAVIPAAAGFITAYFVSAEKAVPAFMGLASAVVAWVVSAGLVLDDGQQSAILVFLGLVVAVVVRDRVTAPVPQTPALDGLLDVIGAQRLLGVPEDGIYGPRTIEAVRAFQVEHGLDDDGLLGPATLRELRAA